MVSSKISPLCYRQLPHPQNTVNEHSSHIWPLDIPVQKPRYFGAGHCCPEPRGFRGQSGILEHFPGKVPLLNATKSDGIAVNCAFQVRVYPVQHQGKDTIDQKWISNHSNKQLLATQIDQTLTAPYSRVVTWIFHPLFEPALDQVLAASNTHTAGYSNSIDLIIPENKDDSEKCFHRNTAILNMPVMLILRLPAVIRLLTGRCVLMVLWSSWLLLSWRTQKAAVFVFWDMPKTHPQEIFFFLIQSFTQFLYWYSFAWLVVKSH